MMLVETEYIERTLRKLETLKLAGILCREPQVRPRAWLNNFPQIHQFPAAVILDALVYYSDAMTTALLSSTYQDLLDIAHANNQAEPINNAVITAVEDETPNPSDSGNLFCRKARYALGVPEQNVLRPVDALRSAIGGNTVIFVDDFIGSGEQIKHTWSRRYLPSFPRSFSELAQIRSPNVHYLVLVTTKIGLQNAALNCPGLQIVPGHVLDDEYSVRHIQSFPQIPQDHDLQNGSLHDRIHELLAHASSRLQLKPFMKQADFALYGFQSMGLMLGFEHGVPDASLPILWASGNHDWVTLLQTT
ncbi:MAG: hypothetical protein RLO46_22230 [Pseudomonadales bacterium]